MAQQSEIDRELEGRLRRGIKSHEDAWVQLQADVARNPLSALEWGEDAATQLAYGDLFQIVKHRVENGRTHLDAFRKQVKVCEEQLLENFHRHNSTSAFVCAVNEAKRAAASRFVRDYAYVTDVEETLADRDRCDVCGEETHGAVDDMALGEFVSDDGRNVVCHAQCGIDAGLRLA